MRDSPPSPPPSLTPHCSRARQAAAGDRGLVRRLVPARPRARPAERGRGEMGRERGRGDFIYNQQEGMGISATGSKGTQRDAWDGGGRGWRREEMRVCTCACVCVCVRVCVCMNICIYTYIYMYTHTHTHTHTHAQEPLEADGMTLPAVDLSIEQL